MAKNTEYIKKLIERYGQDEKSLLKENPSLSNLYIFSNQREGMIEWFPFSMGADILQVGADSGAITGVLLKSSNTLTILDQDTEELEIVKMRYKDLERYRVIAGDIDSLNTYTTDIYYDYIVICPRNRKINKALIDGCRALLKEDGQIIMATDNKYGVKAWSGSELDDNIMSRQDIITLFDRDELSRDSDQGSIRWYYPMPDWKLPSVIYSDDYLPTEGELGENISAYNDSEYVTIDVSKRFDSICRDNKFKEYCNSYIVVWSRHE